MQCGPLVCISKYCELVKLGMQRGGWAKKGFDPLSRPLKLWEMLENGVGAEAGADVWFLEVNTSISRTNGVPLPQIDDNSNGVSDLLEEQTHVHMHTNPN